MKRKEEHGDVKYHVECTISESFCTIILNAKDAEDAIAKLKGSIEILNVTRIPDDDKIPF